MSAVRLTFLSAFALAAGLTAGALASEVKGPVHITGSGVEMLEPGEWEASSGRFAAAEAARDAHDEASAAIREAISEGRAAAREAQREARAAAREAHEIASEAAREARAHARAAMDEAMAEVRAATGHLRLNIRYTVDAQDGVRLDLVHAAHQLAAAEAGDFAGTVIVRNGEMRCAAPSDIVGCKPLGEADKVRLTKTLRAALEAAANAMRAAQAGLGAAPRAEAQE
jgi:hypothetical protein